MNNYLRHILLPAFVGLVIFTATCLINSKDVPNLPQIIAWDKMAHFGMFFILSAVCLFDYYRLHGNKPRMSRWIFWGFAIPVVYGGSIELIQKYFFVSRSAEWGDFIADVFGSAAALIIAIFLHMSSKRKFG